VCSDGVCRNIPVVLVSAWYVVTVTVALHTAALLQHHTVCHPWVQIKDAVSTYTKVACSYPHA
jgi:uncharacterized membrane protein YeiH